MNHMLPIPPLLLLVLLAAEVLPPGASQVADKPRVAADGPTQDGDPAAASTPRPVTGQELVSQAAQRLLMLPGIVLLVLLEKYMKSEYLSMFGRI